MACSRHLQETVPKNRLIEYWNIFNKVDKNKDGYLTRQELVDTLRDHGKALDSLDNTGSSVDFTDFIHLMESLEGPSSTGSDGETGPDSGTGPDTGTATGGVSTGSEGEDLESESEEEEEEEEEEESPTETSEEQLRQIFAAIDTNGSGQITTEELFDFLKSQGQEITEEVYKEMHETDKNGDGQITFDEFRTLTSKDQQNSPE